MKTNNSAWVLFAVVCFGAGILLGCDTRSTSVNAAKPTTEPAAKLVAERPSKPIAEPQPLFTPQAATLAQQKMCDEQAGKKFRENIGSDNISKSKNTIRSYTSHYDPTVNVCYVRINSTSAQASVMDHDVVSDAFGGRTYANYVWSNWHKENWEVPPTACEIDIPGKPAATCKTEEEFDELTEKYFGVAKY